MIVVGSDSDAALRWQVQFGGYTSTTTAAVLDPLYAREEGSARRVVEGRDLAAAPEGECVPSLPERDP